MGSLWGQLYDCDACDFVFSSSHSYGLRGCVAGLNGDYWVICGHCLRRYHAMTSGVRGAEDGERMPLYRRLPVAPAPRKPRRGAPAARPIEDTGVTIDYYDVEATSLGERCTLASTACPDCRTVGSLRMDFVQGEICPQCEQGQLRSQSATGL